MENIIQIRNRFFKEHQLVMLPTKKAIKGQIGFDSRNYEIFTELTALSASEYGYDYQPQHLYLLSEENISKNDYVYDSIDGMIAQFVNETAVVLANQQKETYGKKTFFKIIATTDKSLLIDYYDSDSYGIPQRFPLPSFDEIFLKKYCELGGIDKVLVEYRQFDNLEYKLVFTQESEVFIRTAKLTYTIEEHLQMMHECWLQATAKTLEPLTEKGFTAFMYEKYLL